MTKRAVVAIASVKKRDTMMSRNVIDGGNFGSVNSVLNGVLWCATARPLSGINPNSTSTRSSSKCWMKGIAERIAFESDTSDPWDWRRIIFTVKGPFPESSLPQTQYTYFETDFPSTTPLSPPGGITNPNNAPGNIRVGRSVSTLSPAQLLFVTRGLMRGTRGMDYLDPFLGVPDSENYSILSDKVTHMRSGNDSSLLKDVKFYHRLGRTIHYADVESGNITAPAGFSSNSLNTMGDVYIFYMYKQLGAAPANLTWNSTTTLYWHER
jgi:hypothetical protein